MGKEKREKNYEAVAEARLRNYGVPARKVRLVADLIRGKRVADAMTILRLTHKPSAAPAMLNVLKSAVANAEQAGGADVNDLVIGTVFVDAASMLKRMRPAPMGRGVTIRKRTCHITLRLTEAQAALRK
jgi:large subunit ribosomal protein L22